MKRTITYSSCREVNSFTTAAAANTKTIESKQPNNQQNEKNEWPRQKTTKTHFKWCARPVKWQSICQFLFSVYVPFSKPKIITEHASMYYIHKLLHIWHSYIYNNLIIYSIRCIASKWFLHFIRCFRSVYFGFDAVSFYGNDSADSFNHRIIHK